LARKPKSKECQNTRLLKPYASWIYCEGCNKTIAYLCYVTYDAFAFTYTCACGNCGSVSIQFEHEVPSVSDKPLAVIKNRLCCPVDSAPLLTVVEKNLVSYSYRIVCNTCHTAYSASLETKGGQA